MNDAIQYSLEIIERNMLTLDEFPESCSGEQWNYIESLPHRPRHASYWVAGFWTGLLWLAYAHTQDARFESAARQWTERLAWLKESTATHDLGFIFYLSHVLGARLSGDESLYGAALHAAGSLIKRYNAQGEYLQAWGTPDGTPKDRGRTNIDVMMNLTLLYWASAFSGDPVYATIATQHARTSRLTLLRGDGSTAHVADFDLDTGVFVRRDTYQGFGHDSCWSRGQAWALYGFATCYAQTGIPAFKGAARATAGYVLANQPDDHVPFWDYAHPDIPDTYRDSSAAAVNACGLLEMAGYEDDPARWRQAAEQITISLYDHYSARGTAIPALLRHGSRSVPHKKMDHALIYGDYYFFEALTRLARSDIAARAFPVPTY